MVINTIRDFLRLESASGILLLIAAVLAMLIVNSPAKFLYDLLLETPVEIRIGAFGIAKPLLLWINNGLMAVFFFLIGLEVKREIIRGELSDPSRVTLPVIAAIGGIVIPAVIYFSINWGDAAAMRGWAIPCATGIAFTLGVLSLLGNRVPYTLKLFLLTLAIVSDLAIIIVIAIFYTTDIANNPLLVTAAALATLFIMNRIGVLAIAPYVLVGMILWISVLKSGVHATLAGVLLAFFIPLKVSSDVEISPLEQLIHDLHPTVAYAILPVFSFANAGVSLQGLSFSLLLEPVPLGIIAGLFIGHQCGVFGFCWIAVKSGLTKLPNEIGWLEMYGLSLLCGIGFTMSFFVSSLTFEHGSTDFDSYARIGILVGSLLSAVTGYFVLRFALDRRVNMQTEPVI
jgi:NhaA family Na+:H+ antiporter